MPNQKHACFRTRDSGLFSGRAARTLPGSDPGLQFRYTDVEGRPLYEYGQVSEVNVAPRKRCLNRFFAPRLSELAPSSHSVDTSPVELSGCSRYRCSTWTRFARFGTPSLPTS